MNTSSSPHAEPELIVVSVADLYPHPLNANEMSDERLDKLARNIEREDRYPPLVARPHPSIEGAWRLLDGHQRFEVLKRLGHDRLVVYPWPCDDETALILLSTLNRLAGEDVPARRAELLAELAQLRPAEELAALLPESEHMIAETLELLNFDVDELLDTPGRAAEPHPGDTRAITFAVPRADEQVVEEAVGAVVATLDGKNRRGRAIAEICRVYLAAADE